MKLAHIADPHWGPYPGPTPTARFDDICDVMDWAAEKMIEERVDICLFAGDAFKDSRIMLDRARMEIEVFLNWLNWLSRHGISVVAISGTPSHDAISAYELLRNVEIPKCNIVTTPYILDDFCWGRVMPAGLTLSEKAQKDVAELLECSTDEFGGMCAFTDGHHKINIACIPGLNRSALLTREEFQGKDPREIHRIMTDKITGIAQGLLAARDETNWPTVLLSHITYSEADTGFDHLLLEHEPLLTPEAVEGFDLVCLGHIHRPQKINGKVFYCGAPERHSFNDEHVTPGFWIHEMTGKGQPVESRFIETPARRFVTLDITSASVDASRVRGLNERGHDPLIEDAVIRVRLQAPEEVGKLLDRKEIEKEFYKDGAYFVQEIKIDAERTDRSRDETVTESLAPIEALEKWSEQQGIGKDEIRELISMAGELLAEGVA